jgi:hypothetical protein
MATADALPIYKASSDCLLAFQKCLHNSGLYSYEDQLGRFNLWAANINVFSSSRASLDNRLKTSDGTRDMIVQLLRALQMNLEYCKTYHLLVSATNNFDWYKCYVRFQYVTLFDPFALVLILLPRIVL